MAGGSSADASLRSNPDRYSPEGVANTVTNHTAISELKWSLAIVTSVLVVTVIGVAALFGTQIAGQIGEVFERAPEALAAAGESIGISDASERLAESIAAAGNGQLFSSIAGLGYSVLGGLTDFVLVFVAAVYLAADPRPYREGVAKLFPGNQQKRVLETMNLAAVALRQWFSGQLVSMLAVGVASGIGFWLIGLPSPIGLGIIAGASNFVPLIGPLLGAIPALLFAFLQEPTTVLWVAMAVLAIQQVEGNFLMPLVQRNAVDLPPAVALLSILVFGALFGPLGVIFATPLAVLTRVLVQKLWIHETLGVETKGPGQPHQKPARRAKRRTSRRMHRAS